MLAESTGGKILDPTEAKHASRYHLYNVSGNSNENLTLTHAWKI